MIGVGVRHHRHRDATGMMPREKRRHHSASGVVAVAPWSRVHQDPAPRRSAQQRGVALANVEKM